MAHEAHGTVDHRQSDVVAQGTSRMAHNNDLSPDAIRRVTGPYVFQQEIQARISESAYVPDPRPINFQSLMEIHTENKAHRQEHDSELLKHLQDRRDERLAQKLEQWQQGDSGVRFKK